ncbi:hypothetical protein M3Y98_00150000 [Aphelenchoides besseyi]|nr:hypothetical protein M3Y98_00150000 [Aphelenchoides besseyi]
MRTSWLLSGAFCCLSVALVVDACARTNGGGGTSATTTVPVVTTTTIAVTTTTASRCQAMAGDALLAGDFTVSSTLWGAVSPVASCTNCAASATANYYPVTKTVNIQIVIRTPVLLFQLPGNFTHEYQLEINDLSDEKAIGGVTCTNLCVCSPDGTCYTRTDQNVNVVLYPYCNAGTCNVYAVVVAQDDTQGISDGTTTITAAQQINPATLDRLPITSGQYPEVSYASCSGCATTTTC